ncbi:MAG: hypothetical protein WC326_02940 [Candidatus Delongbacteria bacterium]
MRPRRWILALLLIPALFLMGFLAAWRLLGLEENLRLQVLHLLARQGLERVQLAAVRPAWLGLDLRGLGFTRPGGGLRLESRQVRLRLTPLDWLFHPGSALSAVDWVELQDFRLVADRSLFTKRQSAAPTPTLEEWLRRLAPALRETPEIRLRGGTLVWVDGAGTRTLLLDRLEGVALPLDAGLEVLLRSQLLGDRRQAFRADLRFDPATLDGRFHVRVDSLGKRLEKPDWWPGLRTVQAWSSLTLGGRLQAGKLDSLAGQGRLALSDARLGELQDPWHGSLELELGLDSVRVERGRLERRGEQLEFGGALPWRLEGATAWLRAADLDLGAQCRGLPPLKGWEWERLAGRLDLQVDGVWRQGPRLDVLAALRGLQLDGRDWGEARATGSWRDGVLGIRRLDWQPRAGVSASATGEVRGLPGRPDLRLDTRLLAELARLPGLQGLLVDSTRLELDLRVETERRGAGWRLGRLDVNGRLLDPRRELLGLAGGALPGQLLDGHPPEGTLSLRLPSSRQLGLLELVNGETLDWTLTLEGLARDLAPLLGLRESSTLDALSGVLRLQGRGLETEAEAELSWGGRRALVDGHLAWSDSLRALSAGLVLEGWRNCRLEGQVEASLRGRRLELGHLQLEGLEASGWLDLDSRRSLVELTADDLPLQPYWDLLVEDPAPLTLGNLSLMAAGEGTLDSLGLRGGLEWRQRLLGRQTRLRADLSLDRSQARVERGRLNVDGLDWAALEGIWSLKEGPRALQLDLLERDLAELADTAPGQRPLLEGRLGGSLRADLRSGGPGLVAWLNVQRPRWGGLVFERLDLRLGPSSQAGALSLDSLVLVRGGPFPLRLEARGTVPFRAGDLELDVQAAGDFLHPLTITRAGRPSTFFRSASGQGELRVQVGGTLLDPQLREGRLTLLGGSLDLASVAKKVRDLNLQLGIQAGRLGIEQCEARLGDTRLLVGNTWEAEGPEGELEPWVFERPGLDCGILTLQTLDRRGGRAPVELTIPGLMEPDWSGAVALAGSRPGQLFCLAGPLERPVLTGRAFVDNAEFTFPFIKGEGPRTPLLDAIIGFLNRMEWDVALEAGRHVNYFCKVQGFDDRRVVERFAGYLDRITVDVYLDPTPTPVLFSGQIEDESFRVLGDVTCTRGSVIFLDKEFDVEEAGLSFDASTLLPVVWGRARHTVLARETDPGLQGLFGEDARQIWLQFRTDDELGNRQLRGRWDEIRVELVDDLNSNQDLLERGQEELLVEMGLNPYDPGGAIETMLPDVVAGFWEIPLRPIESRLRRQLRLDEVRIFLPVLRNTVEELLASQTRQEQASQSYLDYLQGTRVTLGKALGNRTFASWTGQLVASTPVEGRTLVRIFQRMNLDYEVSRHLNLSGELVFDPLRTEGALKGDPRILLRYRQSY